MAYRHPSGAASDLRSGEFQAATQCNPRFCPWDPVAELAGDEGASGVTTAGIAAGERQFVAEFVRDVLLKLGADDQNEEQEDIVDLVSQTPHAASAHSAAASSHGATARPAVVRGPRPPPESVLVQMDTILRKRNAQQHYAVEVNALSCLSVCPRLASLLLAYPTRFLPLAERALSEFQAEMLACPTNASLLGRTKLASSAAGTAAVEGEIDPDAQWIPKRNVHFRLHSLPLCEGRIWRREIASLHSEDVGRLVQLRGTVLRSGPHQVVESERVYECRKCNHRFRVGSDLDQNHALLPPSSCPAPGRKGCKSTAFQPVEGAATTRDYQRLTLQDCILSRTVGSLPRAIQVALHDDLVNVARAGDEVQLVAVVRRQWPTVLQQEALVQCELYLDAMHVKVMSERGSGGSGGEPTALMAAALDSEHARLFRDSWRSALMGSSELGARDRLVASLCPQLYGLSLVKLAVLLTLCGGVASVDNTGSSIRGDCHLLMIGDAGTGKSQLLKYASRLCRRSVLTTGTGTSAAGLTAASIKSPGGEWSLEAGALVLASGGVCAIDELGCMGATDRAALHEALEAQQVTLAKAGMLVTLPARTTVIAAMNPKVPTAASGMKADLGATGLSSNLPSSLLSRFDLMILLLDRRSAEWDERVADFLLDGLDRPEEEEVEQISREQFKREKEANRQAREEQRQEGQQGSSQPSSQHSAAAGAPAWSQDQLRAYIAYVRSHFTPALTPLAQAVLSGYYQHARGCDSRSAARTTLRLLESLVRLTQAHARLMFRPRATVQDALAAVRLMDASVASTADDGGLGGTGSLGLASAEVLHSGASATPDADYPAQLEEMLHRLRVRPTPEQEEAEAEAEEANARDVLLGAEGEREMEMVWRERNRARREERKLAPMFQPTPQLVDVSIANEFASDPMEVFVAPVHSMPPPRPPPPATRAPVSAPAPPPPAPPVVARPRAIDASRHLSQSTQDVFWDPFATAVPATTANAPAAAPAPPQRAAPVATANAGITRAAPAASSVDDVAPAAKRPRLGARPMASPPTARVEQEEVEDLDDDEEQSVLVLAQSKPSRAAVRASQRSVVSVKQEPQDHGAAVPKPRQVQPALQRAGAAPRAPPTASPSRAAAAPRPPIPAPVPAPIPAPAPAPAPVVSTLEGFVSAGFSVDSAQAILNNPLRQAFAAVPPPVQASLQPSRPQPQQPQVPPPAKPTTPAPVASVVPAPAQRSPPRMRSQNGAVMAKPQAVKVSFNSPAPAASTPQQPLRSVQPTASNAAPALSAASHPTKSPALAVPSTRNNAPLVLPQQQQHAQPFVSSAAAPVPIAPLAAATTPPAPLPVTASVVEAPQPPQPQAQTESLSVPPSRALVLPSGLGGGVGGRSTALRPAASGFGGALGGFGLGGLGGFGGAGSALRQRVQLGGSSAGMDSAVSSVAGPPSSAAQPRSAQAAALLALLQQPAQL